MTGIFDTHAHYDDARFDADRDEAIARQFSDGVELIVNCGASLESSRISRKLAQRYDGMYFAAGIHPEAVKSADIPIDELKSLLADPKAVAVGEIGLEYYYEDGAPREIQREVFEKQIYLAAELNMPVIVHDREAHDDILEILTKHRPKGVVHRFSGDVEMAKKLLDLGLYLGFGCATTYKSSRNERETASFVPADRLLLETDCPYLAPAHIRRERCESLMIPFAAELIAELRGTDAQTLIDLARQNGKTLFGIK